MDPKLKKILRGISLEIRRLLEGRYDEHGQWQGGDLERRLNELGLWRDRNAKPVEELPHLSVEDKAARRLVDGYLKLREEAGVGREEAVSEFVRESAYTWANRLFALRCMEARGIIDEVILQKDSYGGRSLAHFRFAKKNPDACTGNDDGLFAVLFAEFEQRAKGLPIVFDPKSPAVALRPSIAALKRTIAWLSGRETVRGQDAATDEVFAAPDAFGWAYQYWNAEEQKRVFEMVRTKKGAKIEGSDIVPATQFYTEPYMVKFLVQNSLGALWMGMYPDSKLCEQWEYYVKDADRAPVTRKPIREITFLDPAQGSGHFHLEAFDLFYAMYAEEAVHEGRMLTPREICAEILNRNLYGIDIDGRSVQIATAALWMKAKERAPELEAGDLMSFHEHLVATNIRLPKGEDHLELFLHKHPEDEQLRPALELVFQGLEHADELGALLQIEGLVDAVLRRLKEEADKSKGVAVQPGLFEKALVQGTLAVSVEDYDKWKRDALNRLQAHFETEAQASDPVQAFFGESARKSLAFFNVLSRRFDVVAANPPYMGSRQMGEVVKAYMKRHYPFALRDVCGAFLSNSIRVLAKGGISAFVTQQSWLFSSSFAVLRHSEDGTGVLDKSQLCLTAHLGSRAFSEVSGEVVSVAMTVICNQAPTDEFQITAYSLLDCGEATQKAQELIRAVSGSAPARRFVIPQCSLGKIPGSPITYWLHPQILPFFKHPSMDSYSVPAQGLKTSNNARFVRYAWEVPNTGIRWVPFSKGEGYRKWLIGESFRIDWDFQGARLKNFNSELLGGQHWSRNVTNTDKYFCSGLVYTYVACGKLSVREVDPRYVIDAGSPVMVIEDELERRAILGYLNTRLANYLARILSQNLFNMTGVRKLPVPSVVVGERISSLTSACVGLKRELRKHNIASEWFEPDCLFTGLINPLNTCCEGMYVEALLALFEGAVEKCVYKDLKLSSDGLDAVFSEAGIPCACHPVLLGTTFVPAIPKGVSLSLQEIVEVVEDQISKAPTVMDETDFKSRLRNYYEAGFEGTVDLEDPPEIQGEGEDELEPVVGTRIPLPAETFLEHLSQELEANPTSIFWHLKEGIEREGWRCPSEERRLTEDRFTVLVLRLLGHRWPKQFEAGDPLPAWAHQDGVIPLTSGGGETPLVERVRKRLAEDFPGGNVGALEREFEEIVGVPLEQWLAGPFFERHISQFKKRPIAWHLETEARSRIPEAKGKGKAKKGAKSVPVFACLLYYHKLNAGLLPKIRTHYVGVLKGGYETELRTLERMANLTAEQQGRKLQLDAWIEEMKAFDAKLEQVSASGFGPAAMRPALRQYAINDALLSLTACWLKRLTDVVATGPVSKWQHTAAHTKLHDDLPSWIGKAFARLDFFCAAVGPELPEEKSFASDPTSKNLAPLVCASPAETVSKVLDLACNRWWQDFDENVLVPLKEQLKQDREEQERMKEELELDEVKRDYARQKKLADRKDELKKQIKALREDIGEKTDKGKRLRAEIESWTCPEAATWEDWLGAQPLYDAIASLDGERNPPATIGEFIAQESTYAPDINDGVRVNIAPVQKAGLLHADVLDLQDADKAISDRAEWRADERRWVREGKLPQPGWWAVAVE